MESHAQELLFEIEMNLEDQRKAVMVAINNEGLTEENIGPTAMDYLESGAFTPIEIQNIGTRVKNKTLTKENINVELNMMLTGKVDKAIQALGIAPTSSRIFCSRKM